MDAQKRRRTVGRYLGWLASQRCGNTHRGGALILKAINCPPHPRPWGPIWIPWVIHPCSMVSMVLAPWAPTGGGMGGGGGMGPWRRLGALGTGLLGWGWVPGMGLGTGIGIGYRWYHWHGSPCPVWGFLGHPWMPGIPWASPFSHGGRPGAPHPPLVYFI